MWKIIKRNNKSIFEYPSIDHLNCALRNMLKHPKCNKAAIEEICYAITKGGGYFYEDVAKEIEEHGLFKLH